MASTPSQQRLALVDGGMVHARPLPCKVCGRPMQPGEMVLCGDGYERRYGEFVLSKVGAIREEDNWPTAHADCAATPQAETD